MSYILIQNKGELPLWGMRLLGLSNKNEDQIGQFGTGLKEAIALLARNGLFPIIYSGLLRMDFSVQELDGQEEICFRLSEQRDRFTGGDWHGLGVHPNFGKADWDNPWMIFREIICNALDASGKENLYHDVTSLDPEGHPGATRVYVPAIPEMLEAYGSIYHRLLPLSTYTTEQVAPDIGRAISKRKQKNLQVFYKGIWIQEAEEASLFDYEIHHLKLNESRSADWYNVNNAISRMIAFFSVKQAQSLLTTVLKDEREIYETSILPNAAYYIDKDANNWREAFFSLFGDNAVLTDNSKFFYDKLIQMGKNPVVVTGGLYSLLQNAGVPTAGTTLSREQMEWQDVTEPTTKAQEVFDTVWHRLTEAGLTRGASKPPLRLFTERLGKTVVTFGQYYGGTCYINIACCGSKHERWACIGEILHHVTQANDGSMELQHFLLEAIDTFMTEKANG